MLPGERFNTCTHGLGLALSILGVPIMLAKTVPGGDVWRIAGGLVFSLSCVVLYAASTFFHGTYGAAKLWWQRMDHCAIYLLIAGSYTPFALVAAQDFWDLAPLVAVWITALAGIVRELGSTPPRRPLALYIGMGWVSVAAAAALFARMGVEGLQWLLIGAAFYTLGTVFYANRLGYRHAHGIWHLFVMGGTVSHYVAVAAVVA